ncbi:tetratricopeptide repeat protein [Corynebacterium minutissimum]
MSDSKSRDHGRGRERSSDSNRGNNRSGGRRFDKRGGVSGRREERRGNRRDERRNDRKGHDRDKHKVSHPQRSGYREERINRRMTDPDLPSDIDITDLDPSVLQDLSSLSKENSEAVAKHLIMAATWLDDDPQLSLRHARAAKDRAGRVSVAREMNGIAAYRAGEWKEALAELRAARRISGGPGLLAVMADCERGLGRPEKAVELWRSDDAKELAPEDAIELAIVAAGARLDMGQADSAVVTIQRAQPNKNDTGVAACRLSYAYGNALLEAGRKDDAKEWFQHASDIDEGDWTDAAERLAEC